MNSSGFYQIFLFFLVRIKIRLNMTSQSGEVVMEP